jgi:hypothetical protein
VSGAGPRAAARLLDRKEEVARSVTAALFAEMPALAEKYGERGRQKCLHDMRLNVEHLAPAVDLERPEMFAEYASWVDWVLRTRSVPTEELVRSIELMEAAGGEGMEADERAVLAACVRAGLDALQGAEAR